MTGAAGPRTFGVEEEFHLVEPRTRQQAPASPRVLESDTSNSLEAELQRSMVETGTPVCRSLTELREQLVAQRSLAAAAAALQGLRLVAAGTVPPRPDRGTRHSPAGASRT